jgi:hypothetical protein
MSGSSGGALAMRPASLSAFAAAVGMNAAPAAKIEPAATRSNFCFVEICILLSSDENHVPQRIPYGLGGLTAFGAFAAFAWRGRNWVIA